MIQAIAYPEIELDANFIYTDAAVLEHNKTIPIFIISGCCEPAHGSPEIFKSLGLAFDESPEYTASYPNWGFNYPLTKDESKFIGEDYANGPHGGLAIAYAVLYKNKKWFAPLIEMCYLEGKRFSEGSYGGTAFKTSAEALAAGVELANKLEPRLQAIGGEVAVIEHVEEDRHDVLLLIPVEYPIQQGFDYDQWKTFLEKLVN